MTSPLFQSMCPAFNRRAIPSASIFCSRLSTATSAAENLDAIDACYSPASRVIPGHAMLWRLRLLVGRRIDWWLGCGGEV